MGDRVAHIEAEIARLDRALREVQARLLSLESAAPREAAAPPRQLQPALTAAAEATVVEPSATQLVGMAALIGRTLLLLGGGYLVRAVTEAAVWSRGIGVTLGLAYAVAWLAVADRTAARQKPLSATFYALATSLLALPLLWETTARFGDLPPAAGAALVGVVAALQLGVAWRWRLVALGWVALPAAAVATGALVASNRELATPALVMILLGAASILVATDRVWPGIPWMGVALASLAGLLVSAGALIERSQVEPTLALLCQLLLLTSLIGSLAPRLSRPTSMVSVFDIVAVSLALTLGYGAAQLTTAIKLPALLLPTSLLGTLAGAWGLGVLLRRPLPDIGRHRLFAGAASFLFLAGTVSLVPSPALLWAPLAIVLALVPQLRGRTTAGLLSALLALFALMRSGTVTLVAYGWSAPGDGTWPPLRPTQLLCLLAVAAAALLPAAGATRRWPASLALTARLLSLTLLLASSGAFAIILLSPLIGAPGHEADLGALAVLRTAVAALLVVTAAFLGRIERLRQASWLVYPLLGLGGLKLAFEDFRFGRPATLVLSLALYGVAWILAARWMAVAKKDSLQGNDSES